MPLFQMAFLPNGEVRRGPLLSVSLSVPIPMMQRYIIFDNLSVNKCFNFVRMCIIF